VRDEEAGGWDWEARRKIVTEVAERKSNVHGGGAMKKIKDWL
jgi:hypothetical protein